MSIQLHYDLIPNKRIWLLPGNFDLLHGVLLRLCEEIVYPISCQIEPGANTDLLRYYNVRNPTINFKLYETDTYPPDGHKGLFFHASDYTPGPWGNMGAVREKGEFQRCVALYQGTIVHNPEHGEHNASEREPPRSRKSVFSTGWGFQFSHIYFDGKPTNEFRFHLDASTLSQSSAYGLLRLLELLPVTKEELIRMPGYQCLRDQYEIVDLERGPWFEEEFDQQEKCWRPFVNIWVKNNWLNSEWIKVYV